MAELTKYFNIPERALVLAESKHLGQFRKNSKEPYINHPKRVAECFNDILMKASAYLHDVLEDTSTTEKELLDQFPDEVVNTVKILTKLPNENYRDFIDRIVKSGNSSAMLIKIVDIRDNLRDLEEGSLKDKYRLAEYILLTAIGYMTKQV